MEKIKDLLSPHHEETGVYEKEINEMINCELIEPDELWIHVSDVREKPLSEKLKLFRDGFSLLCESLQTEPELGTVQKISGMSWIVAKNPKLVSSFGFTISHDFSSLEKQRAEYEDRKDDRDVHPEMAPGYAYMDKDTFISMYGKTTKE